MLQGCHQVAKALNVPPTAVLGGYVVLCSYVLSPSIVTIPGTDWTEPVLIWLTVAMPTGSGKSTLFRHLYNLLSEVRREAGVAEDDPTWVLDDATFEKMGALMHENCSRILGFYDELSSFLTQVNLFRGRQLSDSHELVLAGTSWDVPGCGGISGHVRRGTSECGPYWAGTSWDVPGCGGISGHVRRGTSECGPYWAGTSWDVPGCGDILGHVRRGTSECGPYWAGTSWDVPGCGDILGHVRRGTSECGPYWAGTSWDVPGCGDILGHVRRGTSECGPFWLDILGCP